MVHDRTMITMHFVFTPGNVTGLFKKLFVFIKFSYDTL